jgi:hypothetical protein
VGEEGDGRSRLRLQNAAWVTGNEHFWLGLIRNFAGV